MTIANTTNRTSVVGSGAIGQAVPIPFPYTDTSDLIVYSRLTSTGAETLLAETTNYTLTAGSDAGGTLTTVTAVAATSTIHIIRDTPTTQTLDLEAGGTFNAENIEDALDKNTKLSIENADSLDRCLRLDDTDPGTATLPNAVDRAGKYLYFDDDGAPAAAASVDTSASAISVWGETLIDDASAAAARATLSAQKQGYIDVTESPYNATGTGADDTAAIQAALDAATSTQVVFFPSGTYMVTGLTVGTAQILQGTNNSTIKLIAASNDHVINTSADTTSKLYIRDLTIDGNRANQTTAGNGINLAGGAYVLWTKLERVFITECYNYGLYVDNANIVSVEDCRIGECRYGAYILDSEEVNFIGANIEICDTYCLNYDTSIAGVGSRITDCWFETGATTPTDYIIINATGIEINSCRFNMGDGATYGPTNSGIRVKTGITDTVIMGNSMVGTLYPGTTNFIVFDSGAKGNISIGNRGGSGGTIGGGTTDNDGANYILEYYGAETSLRESGRIGRDRLALDNTGTPSVKKGTIFYTGGTTTITDFDDGVEGQIITIICAHSITFDASATDLVMGSSSINAQVNDTLTWICNVSGGAWHLLSYNDKTYPATHPVTFTVSYENASVFYENELVVV